MKSAGKNMNSRKIYVGLVLLFLLAALMFSRHIDPEKKRSQQDQFKVWEQRGGADLIAEVNEMYQADTSK